MNFPLEHIVKGEPAKYYGKFVAVHSATEIAEVKAGAYNKIITYNSSLKRLCRKAKRKIKREGAGDFAIFCWGYGENIAPHHYLD